jgi:hypothetical protein
VAWLLNAIGIEIGQIKTDLGNIRLAALNTKLIAQAIIA